MMQMTSLNGPGQNRFTRSLSGSYKMTNDSKQVTYSLRMEGEAVKESVVWKLGKEQSMRA